MKPDKEIIRKECSEILPKENFKLIKVDDLNDHSSKYFLVRASLLQNDTFDTDNKIRVGALINSNNYKDVSGLSMNILGGLFKILHLKYIHKGKAMEYWSNSMPPKPIDELMDDIHQEERVPIFFKLCEIHSVDFPFQREITDRKFLEKIPKGLAVETNDLNVYEITAKLEIRHKPSFGNYWHMEFHIIDPTAQSEDKAIKKNKVKSYKADITYDEQHWTTKLIDALLNDLKELGMREVKGEWDEIPKNLYEIT